MTDGESGGPVQPLVPERPEPEVGEQADVAEQQTRTRLQLTLPGLWGAVIVVALSMTPSLLPRSGFYQGLVSGINAAIGYALAVLAARVWRELADRGVRPTRPRSWRVLAVAGPVLLMLALALGYRWQVQVAKLMDVDGPGFGWLLAVPLGVVVFVLLLRAGRGLRALSRRATRMLVRRTSARAARTIGVIGVVALTWWAVTGVLLENVTAAINQAYSVRNGETPDGLRPPDEVRSGGPGSLIDWDTLGRQGRAFVGRGPTADQISEFNDERAGEPVRIYAGLDSAEDAEARAELAAADLERAGGFRRSYLLVVTTTGSGWVEPRAADSFEYITGGDSAIVATQYSYLPSWISFLVDQKPAREAGRALFDAVYERWSALPQAQRPRLLVFGESLGSFGGETAFSGEQDLRNRTDGALFSGPPDSNQLFREFVAGRDPGSPQIAPVYRDGRTIRFTRDAGQPIEPLGRPWDETRAVYLMNPSDPIVWWGPSLLFHRPDWLEEERGDDVLDNMTWVPILTFWQVSADLPRAVEVPPGHGHNYAGRHLDAWAQILQPPGWTPAKAEELRAIVTAKG